MPAVLLRLGEVAISVLEKTCCIGIPVVATMSTRDMKSGALKIGDLAKATASRCETIRYYEREKLLPPPARTSGNYRLYTQTHVQRLTFIRHCRALDMSLDEIRALLKFYDSPAKDCAGANALIDAHIDHVSHRIAELNRLKAHLLQLRTLCKAGRPARNCEMLHELAAPIALLPPRPPRKAQS